MTERTPDHEQACEPLISPLPSLDLAGIGWVIVGGESLPLAPLAETAP